MRAYCPYIMYKQLKQTCKLMRKSPLEVIRTKINQCLNKYNVPRFIEVIWQHSCFECIHTAGDDEQKVVT